MSDEFLAGYNDDEISQLAEFCHQNYLKNSFLKQENERKSKFLLEEYLQNERKSGQSEVTINLKKFKSQQISISEAIYGKRRLHDTRQIEDLIKTQRNTNLARIANSLNLNVQDFNFMSKEAIDTEKLTDILSRSGTRPIIWSEIAKRYGTKHNEIQLFKHYKTVIKPNLKATEFTKEEELLLKRGIELYRNNSAAITTLLPGRDLAQIHAKRKYFMKKVGKWDKDEDEMLLRAIELHSTVLSSNTLVTTLESQSATAAANLRESQSINANYNTTNTTYDDTNWLAVAEFMQTRNAEQCRNRYINKLNPILDHSKLTNDEKKKVLDLVEELGVGKLKEISSRFPTRSPQMITNCYKVYSRKQAKVNSTSKRKKRSD